MLSFSVDTIVLSLKDTSPYVRRAAVLGCAKLYEKCPEYLCKDTLVNDLYSMVRDPDPIVVTNCLQVLQIILKDEGGVVVNKNIVLYLLNRLPTFTYTGLIFVLRLLCRYTPENEAAVLDIMNMCDFTLTHNSVAVVIEAFKYFMTIVEKLPHLHQPVFQRIKPSVMTCLGSDNYEMIFVILNLLEELIPKYKGQLVSEYRSFFCKHNEPLFVKTKRLSMLPKLIEIQKMDDSSCQTNVDSILEELSLCSKDRDLEVSQCGIVALGDVIKLNVDESIKSRCFKILLGLLNKNTLELTSSVLQVLQYLYATETQNFKECKKIVEAALNDCDALSLDYKGRCGFVSLVAALGQNVDNSPYLLEEQIEDVIRTNNSENEIEFLHTLLHASVSLLLQRPAEMQLMTGRFMKYCSQRKDHAIVDKVSFYYKILKEKQGDATDIISKSSAS